MATRQGRQGGGGDGSGARGDAKDDRNGTEGEEEDDNEEDDEEDDEGDRAAMEWDDWLANMVEWFAHRELRQQKDHEKLVSAITSVRKRGRWVGR